MSPDVKLRDAYDIYGQVVGDMMIEMGLNKRLDFEGQKDVIRAASDEFSDIYDEFIIWAIHGDDKKSLTRALIRGNLILERGWF